MQNPSTVSESPANTDEPIFLVGTTRSGTTLLSLMLGHHPQIAFVGELEWVWDYPDENTIRAWKAPILSDYYAWVQTHRHYIHHNIRLDRSLSFNALARSFLAQMREQTDPRHEKPRYGAQVHRHYLQALETWPKARFIHIVRDGRDVCASWIKFGWLGNAYEAGIRWRDALAEWEAVKPAIAPSQRIELRFEDLITDPINQRSSASNTTTRSCATTKTRRTSRSIRAKPVSGRSSSARATFACSRRSRRASSRSTATRSAVSLRIRSSPGRAARSSSKTSCSTTASAPTSTARSSGSPTSSRAASARSG
jgi:hypothetical protein